MKNSSNRRQLDFKSRFGDRLGWHSKALRSKPVEIALATSIVISLSASAVADSPSNTEPHPEAKQIEARVNIGALIRAQQAYRFENRQFSDSIAELATGAVPNYYDLKIEQADEKTAIITATPNADNSLKSYVGAIAFDNSQFQFIYCETQQPTENIELPTFSQRWQCASDSVEVMTRRYN